MKKIIRGNVIKSRTERTETQYINGVLYGFNTVKENKNNGRKEISINLRTFLPSELTSMGYMHLIEHIKAAPLVSRVQKSKFKDKVHVSANTSYSYAHPVFINFDITYAFYSFDKSISTYETSKEEILEVLAYLDDILSEYINSYKIKVSEARVQQEIPVILSEKTWSNSDLMDELTQIYASYLDSTSSLTNLQIAMGNESGLKLFSPSLISIIGFESDIKSFNAKTLNENMKKLMLRENTAFSISREMVKIEGLEYYNTTSVNKFLEFCFPKTKESLDNLKSINDVKHYYKPMVDKSKIYSTNVTLNTAKRKDIEFIINPDKLIVNEDYTTISLSFNFNFQEKLKRFTLVPSSEINIREIIKSLIGKSVVSYLRENNIPIYSFDFNLSPIPEFEAVYLPFEANDITFVVSFKGLSKEEISRITKFLNTEYRKYLIKTIESIIESDFKDLKDKERATASNGYYSFVKMLSTFDLILENKNYKDNQAIIEIQNYMKPYLNDSYHLYASLEKELNDKKSMNRLGKMLLSSVSGMQITVVTYRN